MPLTGRCFSTVLVHCGADALCCPCKVIQQNSWTSIHNDIRNKVSFDTFLIRIDEQKLKKRKKTNELKAKGLAIFVRRIEHHQKDKFDNLYFILTFHNSKGFSVFITRLTTLFIHCHKHKKTNVLDAPH